MREYRATPACTLRKKLSLQLYQYLVWMLELPTSRNGLTSRKLY
jgi:hypothetical protein